ncbi:MAG: hypothetical protein KJ600_03980 [Nanoarchaeota archaeon]|nr:hypothetical protein [Nanoarchaeota archaeon]MBU1103686.1 hypothetical protein [Nanoarchaeota archaeon]
MKKRFVKILGILLIVIGIVVLLDTFTGITGLVVLEDIGRTAGSVIGIVFVLVGVLVFMSGAAPRGISELETVLGQVVPSATPKNSVILLDADFVKWMNERYERGGRMELNDNYFGDFDTELNDAVAKELSSRRNFKRQPLVPDNVVRYLESHQHVKLEPYELVSETEEHIFSLWKAHTNQGRKADAQAEEKFRESGDMQLLGQAYENGEEHTIILSNNYSEIGKIAEQMRKDNINVYVVGKNNFR